MYLIFITFNGDQIYNWKRLKFLIRLLGIPIDRVIYVDTSVDLDMPDGSVIDKKRLNYFFEFSGYQYGLHKASKLVVSKVLDAIFINDTAFLSHSALHVLCTLYFLVKKQISTQAIAGLSSTFSGNKYISSFLFRVVIDVDRVASRPVFYSLKVLDEMQLAFEDTAYSNAVDDWLNPVDFFSGWYKSMPGKRLNQDVYARKKVAIFMEHNMVKFFVKDNNACFYDLHESSVGLRVTAFYDRVFTIISKIKFRLRNI